MTDHPFMNLLTKMSLEEFVQKYPIATDFFANFRLESLSKRLPLPDALAEMNDEALTEFGLDRNGILFGLCAFLESFSDKESAIVVSSLTIKGGFTKSKEPENIELTIHPGEVVSIVGPTGSGKSRLLGDIECLAQRDTPTGRLVLVNEAELDDDQRFEMDGKLVAQLSQNMNFVMDLNVQEFLEMHAKSRMNPHPQEAAQKCLLCANELVGEKFTGDTKVTQLSGGQSRALMIADTALMSNSPIVLIDEIENAGIDRMQAIQLLAKSEKIILISTHDPLLALTADKRIVIQNGGIAKVILTSPEEKKSLKSIQKLDQTLQLLRNRLRNGQLITESIISDLQ